MFLSSQFVCTRTRWLVAILLGSSVCPGIASALPNPFGADERRAITQPSAFPIDINQSGSYYLAEDITGVASQYGIRIFADDVTIDLNGFTLAGVPGSHSGILVFSNMYDNLTVTNGTIRDWGSSGVDASVSEGCVFRGIKFTRNFRSGIFAGDGALVEDCVATFNNANGGYAGISGTVGCVVRNCVASSNSATTSGSAFGISTFNAASVTGCVARDNRGFGGTIGVGISTGTDSTVLGNTCSGNNGSISGGAGIGITAGDRSLVKGNTCNDNNALAGSGDGIGISNGSFCSVIENVCSSNTGAATGRGVGISSGVRSRIERNQCTGNDGTTGYGIRLLSNPDAGAAVIRNTTAHNANAGIRTENVSGVNYIAENVIEEPTGISQSAPVNLLGTGDRSNVIY